MKIILKNYEDAYQIISQYIEPSPLIKSARLSLKYNCNIYLKMENMLPVGSFKMRGALNKISGLTQKEKKAGIIAVSAGNHAQGVAWAAQINKCKATIVMPINSPLTKIEKTKALGAEIILFGTSVDEAMVHAKAVQKKMNYTFIHPYEDEKVIAGQGTIGIELVSQIDKIDFLFGSIGGGGLVAGMSYVVKHYHPKCTVIAGQAMGASSMAVSLSNHKLIQNPIGITFADGIRINTPSKEMFKLLNKVVDEARICTDDELATAIVDLMETAQTITEGAGALPLAMFDQAYRENPKRFKNKNIVLVVCGGNIDVNLLGKIIDRGLIAKGRKARINVYLRDVPGTLVQLAEICSKQEANILQVIHDHSSLKVGLHETCVELTLETKGFDHLDKIIKELRSKFHRVEFQK